MGSIKYDEPQEQNCKECGKNILSRYTRCYRCMSKGQRERNRKVIEYIIGNFKCWICNYDKCEHALDFHHVDPTQKIMAIRKECNYRMELFLEEIKKCVLICCRCHREVHFGMIPLENILKIQDREWSKRDYSAEHLRKLFNIKTRPDFIKSTKESREKRQELRRMEILERKKIKKSRRPTREILESLAFKYPATEVGKMFGVSDNTVRKWYKHYKLDYPKRGYWAKFYAKNLQEKELKDSKTLL